MGWELNELGCRKQRLQHTTEEKGDPRMMGRDIQRQQVGSRLTDQLLLMGVG